MKETARIIRMACQVSSCVASSIRTLPADYSLSKLCADLDDLSKLRRQWVCCRARGWQLAARNIGGQLRRCLRELSLELGRVEAILRQPEPRCPSLRQVYSDLYQLEQEFGHVELRRDDNSIAVATAHIVLEGVDLGRFEIRLRLDASNGSEPLSMLTVTALDPHPAASDSAVTHPHVVNDMLCSGEATFAMRAALRDGRLCDMFLLTRSVLNTYNAESPYVPLENWDGRPCVDCGYTTDEDECYCCQWCDHDLCDECISYCRSCDLSVCGGCLQNCECCEDPCCESCLQPCSECGHGCCTGCLKSEVCQLCIEEKENNDEIESDEQPICRDHKNGKPEVVESDRRHNQREASAA